MNTNSDTNNQENTLNGYGRFINLLLKSLMSFVGIAMLALGATFLKEGNLGLDPFTAVNTGMAKILHTDLGTYQLGANFVIFIFILILDRKKIGIGTIMNMILVGYEIQWFSTIYESILPGNVNFFVIITNLFLGLILFTAGSSIYMAPNLGVAPYDAIAPIASDRLHVKYRTARVIQDILFLIAGLVVGGPIAIATIITAFFAGPLISFWTKFISNPIVTSIDNFSFQPSFKHVASGVSKATVNGYHFLSSAYNTTVDVQMNLSGYSFKELSERLHDAEKNMNDSQKAFNAYRTQFRMLTAELIKRREKEEQKNNKRTKS